MRINVYADCGNSPKRELLKEISTLFASYDLEKLEGYFAEDIEWHLIGDKSVIGKKKFLQALDEMRDNAPAELSIHSVVNHGKEAALHGEMKMKDNRVYAFSDFYAFSSAASTKIKSITSFVILK